MDGLAIPPKYPGEVFKTVDNVDVTIENDGEICWKTKEVESFFGMFFSGGRKENEESVP